MFSKTCTVAAAIVAISSAAEAESYPRREAPVEYRRPVAHYEQREQPRHIQHEQPRHIQHEQPHYVKREQPRYVQREQPRYVEPEHSRYQKLEQPRYQSRGYHQEEPVYAGEASYGYQRSQQY